MLCAKQNITQSDGKEHNEVGGRFKLRNLRSDKIFKLTFLNDEKWPAPPSSEVRVFQIEDKASTKGLGQLSR